MKKGLALSVPRLAAGGVGRGTGGEMASAAAGGCEGWRCEEGGASGCEEGAAPGEVVCVNGCAGGGGGGDGRCEAGRGSRPKRGLDPSGNNNVCSGGEPAREMTAGG